MNWIYFTFLGRKETLDREALYTPDALSKALLCVRITGKRLVDRICYLSNGEYKLTASSERDLRCRQTVTARSPYKSLMGKGLQNLAQL